MSPLHTIQLHPENSPNNSPKANSTSWIGRLIKLITAIFSPSTWTLANLARIFFLSNAEEQTELKKLTRQLSQRMITDETGNSPKSENNNVSNKQPKPVNSKSKAQRSKEKRRRQKTRRKLIRLARLSVAPENLTKPSPPSSPVSSPKVTPPISPNIVPALKINIPDEDSSESTPSSPVSPLRLQFNFDSPLGPSINRRPPRSPDEDSFVTRMISRLSLRHDTWNGYYVQDVPPDGNCQMHAILGALKKKYPNHEHASKDYTELRKLGAQTAAALFATHEDLKTFVRADINEYNDNQIGGEKRQLSSRIGRLTHQIKELNDQLSRNEISADEHAQRLKLFTDEKGNLMKEQDALTENNGIKDETQYFDRASCNGFWCGQAHLYALSYELNLPIHVHLSTTKDVTVFNPRNSQKEPLELLCRNSSHYNFILGKQ